jgi:hypothetical protein
VPLHRTCRVHTLGKVRRAGIPVAGLIAPKDSLTRLGSRRLFQCGFYWLVGPFSATPGGACTSGPIGAYTFQGIRFKSNFGGFGCWLGGFLLRVLSDGMFVGHGLPLVLSGEWPARWWGEVRESTVNTE